MVLSRATACRRSGRASLQALAERPQAGHAVFGKPLPADADLSRLTYFGGTGEGIFTINRCLGVIRVNSDNLDFEAKESYNFSVGNLE